MHRGLGQNFPFRRPATKARILPQHSVKGTVAQAEKAGGAVKLLLNQTGGFVAVQQFAVHSCAVETAFHSRDHQRGEAVAQHVYGHKR